MIQYESSEKLCVYIVAGGAECVQVGIRFLVFPVPAIDIVSCL